MKKVLSVTLFIGVSRCFCLIFGVSRCFCLIFRGFLGVCVFEELCNVLSSETCTAPGNEFGSQAAAAPQDSRVAGSRKDILNDVPRSRRDTLRNEVNKAVILCLVEEGVAVSNE